MLHSCDQHWIDVKRTWRLNERHYGALQGVSKEEAKKYMGEELLLRFRRGFDQVPFKMRPDHPFWTGRDRRYREIGPESHPTGESLRMCQQRVMPYWQDVIAPSIRSGKRVLISSHNNVLRCLVQHLDRIQDDDLRKIEIPTGVPIVYYLDENLAPIDAPDEVGFRGQFLVDSSKRDDEYVANLEAISRRKKQFSEPVLCKDAIEREEIRTHCAISNLDLPRAWADMASNPEPGDEDTHNKAASSSA